MSIADVFFCRAEDLVRVAGSAYGIDEHLSPSSLFFHNSHSFEILIFIELLSIPKFRSAPFNNGENFLSLSPRKK